MGRPVKCKYLYRVTLPKIKVQTVRWSFEFAAYWVVKTKERQGPDIEKTDHGEGDETGDLRSSSVHSVKWLTQPVYRNEN
jgi:hypothetical protein